MGSCCSSTVKADIVDTSSGGSKEAKDVEGNRFSYIVDDSELSSSSPEVVIAKTSLSKSKSARKAKERKSTYLVQDPDHFSASGKDAFARTSSRKSKAAKKARVKDLIYYLEDPNERESLQFAQIDKNDEDQYSLLSAKSGDSLVFPKWNGIEVLTHTPPKANIVKIEDTFWSEKKKLIPKYSAMEKVDAHVEKAKSDLRSDPKKLAEYLVKPCKNEVEKARAIIKWMGENVQYDTNFLDTGVMGSQTSEDVIRTGKSVCDGYGNAFNLLGSLMGLECKKISGQAKGAGFYPGCFDPGHLSKGPGAHAWNAVKIKGKWYLSDATWAAGSVDKANGKSVFEKSWEEYWFLVEPAYFVLTHIPLQDDTIQAEDQLLDKPIKDAKFWAELALTSPQAGVFGVRPITHEKSVISSTTGKEVVIKYLCQYPLSQFVSVERIEKNGNITTKCKGKIYDDMVSLFTLQDRSIIVARFQKEGMYNIIVIGYLANTHQALSKPTKLLQYRVNVTKKCILKLLPSGVDNHWGIDPDFARAGYSIIYPKQCMINTRNGLAVIKTRLPTKGFLPNMCKLYFSSDKESSILLEHHVIASRREDIGFFKVQCPFKGEYRFEIFAKFDENATGFHVGAAILIKCSSPIPKAYLVNANDSFLQIDHNLHNLGGVTSAKKTILKVKNGEARLRIKKTKHIKFLANLYDDEVKMEGTVTISEDGDVVTFTMKPPRKGFYTLVIFATDSATGSYPFAGRIGVDYDSEI